MKASSGRLRENDRGGDTHIRGQTNVKKTRSGQQLVPLWK